MNECIFRYASPLGEVTLASRVGKLSGLWFDGQRNYPENAEISCPEKSLPIFADTLKWLDIYFGGKEPDFTPGLYLNSTPFRKAVWSILLTIPYGKTMTYGEIARMIASHRGLPKMSAQAVGGAVAHNPISIIIPCHRVVGANGNLTGYAGGIERKIRLLELEHTDMTKLYLPVNLIEK